VKKTAKIAISLVYYLVDSACRIAVRLVGRKPAGRLVVLYYHSVPADSGFARQVDTVARRAGVVPSDYVGTLERGRHYVAITFDDAYQSVVEHAVPELTRRSLAATIFVPVGMIAQTPDWDMEGDDPDAAETVMTEEQLRALPKDLIAIGSHSVSHSRLPEVDDTRLREELAGSRKRLEELLGRKISTLAFPYGAHDDRVVEACRDAGYERVFSIVPRHARPDGEDFVRGRVSVEPRDGALEFFLKMHGAYRWMVCASALKRLFRRRRRAARSTPSSFDAP
jgi:peptidoglycan/xylan/chitin deacetylase (PgdA/CDA1 family)